MSHNPLPDWFALNLEGLPVCPVAPSPARARVLTALLVVVLPLLALLQPALPEPSPLPAGSALAAAPAATATPLRPATGGSVPTRAASVTKSPGDTVDFSLAFVCPAECVDYFSGVVNADYDYTITGHVIDVSPPPAPWDCHTITATATAITGTCHAGLSALSANSATTTVQRSFRVVDCAVTPIKVVLYGIWVGGQGGVTTFQPFGTGGQTTTYDCTSAPAPTPTPGNPGATTVTGSPTFTTPLRVVDTRPTDAQAGIRTTGFGPSGGAIVAGQLADGSTTRFCIGGKTFGATAVPADATALLLNVTAIQGGPSGGFVTVFPVDAPSRPNTSTLNPSSAVSFNFTTVRVPTTGDTAQAGCLDVFSTGAARDLAIDLFGYYRAGAADRTVRQGVTPATANLKFVTPVRVLDTRGPSFGGPIGINPDGTLVFPGQLTPGTVRQFRLAGQGFGTAGVNQVFFPSDVTGIVAHVTTIQGSGTGGFVTLLPGNFTGTPTASTLNPSTPIAFNTTAIGLPPDGTFAVYSTQALDVAVDIVGYYAPSNPASIGALNVVSPVRVLDTRPTNPAQGIVTTGFQPGGSPITAAQLADPSTLRYLVAGGVFNGLALPSDIKAVLVNVTVVQGGPTGGFVTVYPGDATSPPNASTVNPSTGIAASFWATGLPNGAVANAGTLGVFSNGAPRDLLIDLIGYYR